MADPIAPYGRITGRWTDVAGLPAKGSVTVTVTRPPVVAGTGADRVIIVQNTTTPMDSQGAVCIDVLAPAHTDPQAAAWTCTVSVRVPGSYHQTHIVAVTQGTVTDISALIPSLGEPTNTALAAGLTQLRDLVAKLTARVVALESGAQPPGPKPPSPSGTTAVLHRDGSLTIGATRE